MRSTRIPFAWLRTAALLSALTVVLALTGCSSKKNPLIANPLPQLSALAFTLDTDTLAVGGSATLTFTATDTSGGAVSASRLLWESSAPLVARVGSTGIVSAQGEGHAWIRVSGANRTDSVLVVVYTQSGWYAQTSNTVNNLNAIHATADGRTAWAVGDAGTIVTTNDAGVTWTTQVSNTAFKLNGVFFTSPTRGWVAGNNGTILSTSNGGVTWARLTNVGASENLQSVRFVDAAHGWASGSSGAVVRTINGGNSWTKVNPTASTLNSVAFSDTLNGWAVGDNGVICGTHDGGVSWYVWQPAVTNQTLRAAWRASNTRAWAVGAQGVAPSADATTDSLAWTLGTTGASNQLYGVHFPTNLTGYAVGQNGSGLVLRSDDGGASWAPQTANSAQKLNAVWFVDTQRGWAVGDGGRIVHTSQGGQ